MSEDGTEKTEADARAKITIHQAQKSRLLGDRTGTDGRTRTERTGQGQVEPSELSKRSGSARKGGFRTDFDARHLRYQLSGRTIV
jgi:hypothetical protein